MTFASEGKRISYAPSLTGRENETVEQREQYKNWINRIDFLSCREKYGVNYISNITGRKAKQVEKDFQILLFVQPIQDTLQEDL